MSDELPIETDIFQKRFPWQEAVEKALANGAKRIWIKAGRKTGKTDYVRYRMKMWSLDKARKPDQINPYIAPERIQAKNIFWKRLKTSFDRNELEKKPMESNLSIDLKSGVRIQLFGADNEDAVRGLTFGPGTLDEADFMRETFFDEIAEPNFSVTSAPIILVSTPRNNWFTKRWRDARDGLLGREHAAFHYTIYDNPTMDKRYIEKIRRTLPKEIWDNEYMANENAYSGLVYHEFDNDNVVKHYDPPMEGKFSRGLDWGQDHPTVCLWAYHYFDLGDGRWKHYIYNEIVLRGKTVEEIVSPIRGSDSRNFIFNVIDIAALRHEITSGATIIGEFKKHGLSCRPSLRDDAYNINAAKMLLKNKDVIISERCITLIKQLRTVEWNQKKGDDATDAFKYLCGMVYNRDLTYIEPNIGLGETEVYVPPDPMGIFASPHYVEQDTMAWEPY